MKKDFITVTPDSGQGSTDVTVQASKNSSADRKSTITITGGSMTRTVNVSQKGALFFIVVGNSGYIEKIEI